MSNEYQEWLSDFTAEQRKNYDLCMKYPILLPRDDAEFCYEYTKLDFFPEGWKKAFGEQWAKDVQEAIDKLPINTKREAYILDIKEKFGQLRVFLSVFSEELEEVLKKYEKISEQICHRCGKSKTEGFGGWFSYLCDDCEQELMKRRKILRGWADADSQN
jgi:hypothetical protein